MRAARFLYGNIRVMPPGRDMLMFRTSLDRAAWYVAMGLAVFEGSTLLRLTFEPKGPGHSNDPYFLQEFKNRCVVCGMEEDLSHHHVVPECYRKYFPRDSEESGMWMYDVLLLCRPCHKQYESRAWEKKVAICREYGMPVDGGSRLTGRQLRIMKLSMALERHSEKMSDEKREASKAELDEKVGRKVSPEEYGALWREIKESVIYIPMGKLVAEKLTDLHEFSVSWREHFLKVMSPRYLPEGWVADRKIYV